MEFLRERGVFLKNTCVLAALTRINRRKRVCSRSSKSFQRFYRVYMETPPKKKSPHNELLVDKTEMLHRYYWVGMLVADRIWKWNVFRITLNHRYMETFFQQLYGRICTLKIKHMTLQTIFNYSNQLIPKKQTGADLGIAFVFLVSRFSVSVVLKKVDLVESTTADTSRLISWETTLHHLYRAPLQKCWNISFYNLLSVYIVWTSVTGNVPLDY